jgi:hypothetical protein
MPIIRFQSRQCADLPAASCRCYIHPPVRRRHQIPIAPAAPPVPNFPRLRALALFGRRPPQRVEGFVMPASKNLHTTGHAVRSIGSDIIRPPEQWEYQDRLHRSRPHVRELEAVPDCEPSPAGRTETARSPRGMRASRGSGSAPAKACARLSTSKRIVGLIVESRWANWLLCTRTGNCHSS